MIRLRATRTPPAALLVLISCQWLCSCARAPAPLPPAVPMEASSVDDVLEDLRSQGEGVRRYQGFVRLRGRGPEGGFSAKLVVIFERPENLRVELVGPFGGTRWTSVATDDGITAYFPKDRHYVREANVRDVVGLLLGIRLDANEVMALLSGVGVPIEAGTTAAGSRRGETRVLRLDNGARLEVNVDGQVVRAQTSKYEALYTTSWKRRGRTFPGALRLESGELDVTLTMEDIDVNVALAAEAFELEIPEDAVRLRPAEISGEAVFVVTGERP